MSHIQEDYPLTWVDPKLIVNEFCCRPVLPKDIAFIKERFLRNGYVDSHLLTCRYATAPEIEAFYRRPPYRYSAEKAEEVARSYMREGCSGGHTFCYDGHIRKFVSILLIEAGVLVPGFRLKASLWPQLSKQDEIALSLSRNSANEFCVPLSFITTLLRCHDYDQAVNSIRIECQQKHLSATEVGKAMVSRVSSQVVDQKALAKMAETRRQILGITRKLPSCTIDYFRQLTSEDCDGLQAAFTMENLKAVPKTVTPQESLSLVKRIVKYYENSLPVPKAVQARDLAEQLVNVRRAICEFDKFKKLCEYESIPNELKTLVERMLTTQILDNDLGSNSLKDKLFKPLSVGCRNLVPGGTQNLAIADRKLTEIEANLASACDERDNNSMPQISDNADGSKAARELPSGNDVNAECQDILDTQPENVQDFVVNENDGRESANPGDEDREQIALSTDSNVATTETVPALAEMCFPMG